MQISPSPRSDHRIPCHSRRELQPRRLRSQSLPDDSRVATTISSGLHILCSPPKIIPLESPKLPPWTSTRREIRASRRQTAPVFRFHPRHPLAAIALRFTWP